ncbi:MAG TPA: potassium transporter Kup [Hyphomicrobiaceae bacterium]|nr:potassium transporter Kup [Hyphomicrobiaceae bacterium]
MAHAYVPANAENGHSARSNKLWALALGSIGVVYGDIGTSPLYAMREAVTAASPETAAGIGTILGVLSLMVWTLLLTVTCKYVLLLLRMDNKGEGGTFALMALGQQAAKRSAPVIFILGVVGVGFFYGDAVITPAISVLSAVEGLKVLSPEFEPFVLPLTVGILLALFAVQARGTERVGQFFGPITLLWFICLGIGGLIHLVEEPRVLEAFNPLLGIGFLIDHGVVGLTVMGLVFLVATGSEALYADLGHFGRKPIQVAWFSVVLPALMLNYFGQGALLLQEPAALENPFYRLYPSWAVAPMVVLATVATVIASQAVITGAFSLTSQAVQLGLLPRMMIRHTSEAMAGQIYLPRVNYLLLAGVLFVTMVFRSSGDLAAAYGVAVSAEMVIASMIAFFVVWRHWGWSLIRSMALIVPLLLLEQTFFAANALKIPEGGIFPLMVAALMVAIMLTWAKGVRVLSKITRKNEAELEWLVRKLEAKPPHRVPGTAMFLTADPNYAPTSLLHNLKHNRVLHERNIILTIKTEDTPRVARHERISVDTVSDTFIRVVARYGFMETPSVPKILEQCRRKDLNIEISQTSFFLSRRSLKPTVKSEMPRWQEALFIMLANTAEDATAYFRIPSDRVVEVGTQVLV